jgi:starvation-inducible outer membrane lipoprotein
MKKLICMAVALMLMFLFSGCATAPEQRKDSVDLKQSVGTKHFVGDSSMDARGMARPMIGQ